MRILTICHVKHMQSTVLEEERFDLCLLSAAFRNLWLVIVLIYLTGSRHTIIGQV